MPCRSSRQLSTRSILPPEIPLLLTVCSGGEYENKSPKEILLRNARDPNAAPLFNYASMAHNNHFFFQALSPDPTPMPAKVAQALEQSFSSVENLKREFIVTASSMFGPGFVWLVRTRDYKYSLLTTYLAGSPYPGAHYRRQSVDLNTEHDAPMGGNDSLRKRFAEPANRVGAFGPHSQARIAPGGIDLIPVLCLNMWEHAYLPDYGVGAFGAGGKKAYAESWWHVIDWNVVAYRAEISKPPASFMT